MTTGADGDTRVIPAGDPPTLGYRLMRALARALLAIFYRRIEVVGAEKLSDGGPLIVAANHHNSVVDAMLLLALSPRRLRTLANAPLFKHPLLGPLVRLVGALPVHRRQEAGNDPARNAELFAATTATLRAGGAILIFPEGRTQPEPALQELRTGAARMLLAAELEPGAPGHVTLLPVGLVFHDPGTFRSGRALVLIGEPVPTSDVLAEASQSPEAAARGLTERLATALKDQIVEADDRRTLRLLTLAEELRRGANAEAAPDDLARVAWLQGAMRAYRRLQEQQPERAAALRTRLTRLAADLDRHGLTSAQLSRGYAPGAVARFALHEGLALLVGAPLAFAGLIVHGLPYQLTAFVVSRLQRTDEEEATDKIVAGLLLYPLAWVLEAWTALRLGGAWALAAFAAVLLPTAFCALSWRERLEHLRQEATGLRQWVFERGRLVRLRREREAVIAELRELAGDPHGAREGVST